MLEIAHQDGIRHITLNRPEKRNALNLELCRALVSAFTEADADAGVRAILLDANGKAFCAGMDLREAAAVEDDDVLSQVHDTLFTTGMRLTTPLVAAVHGAAIAGGTGLVANAHVVVAAPDATFGLTEIRIGLWPLLVFRAVAMAVGERRATEMSLTGRVISASEAREMGLVTEIAEQTGDRAREIATVLASSSALAIRTGLSYVRDARGLGLGAAGELARRLRKPLIESEEFQTAVRRFAGHGPALR